MLRVATSSLRPSALLLARNACRALASSSTTTPAPANRIVSAAEQQLLDSEAKARVAVWQKLDAAGPEPVFRPPPPMPPTTHVETWAPAALVSADPAQNALRFVTRFYIDATGEQPQHAKKVQLFVKLGLLGLSAAERSRLLAVAGPHYDRKRGELRFTCDRHAEVARNKAELRETVARLVADAREHADGHASAPDAQLPLAARRRPWLPRDPRAYRGERPNRFKNSPG